MRVMLISGEYLSENAGGIASVVHNLRMEFYKKGIEHKIVCTKDYEFETGNGIFLNAWGREPTYQITFGLNFKKIIKNEAKNWDLFHFHLPGGTGPLLFSKKLLKGKILVSVHTTPEGYNRYLYSKIEFKHLSLKEKICKLGYIRIPNTLDKIALNNVENIIAVSSGVKNELESWYKKRNVKVINNGIDVSKLPKSEASETDKPTILYVGRLVAQKGIFLGIEALSNIKEDFNFLVVGRGPLRYELVEYCHKKDINANFLGFVDTGKLYQLYSKSDILLMPSLYEGLPIVGIEGAGSGLPIIAFEGARIEDVVCEENKELICKTGDVKELGEAIEYLLVNEGIRKRIGRKNRKNVIKNFSSEKMTERYIQTYKGLI